jgi:hypothetical protein
VGAYFVYMGLAKAAAPADFLKLVRQYELVDTPLLLNSIAALLPWLEILCGLLLIAGIAVRGAALAIVLMLVPFTVVVLRRALALHAAGHIPFCAIKFDCGCGNGEVYICRKLLENLLLTAAALALLWGRERSWCARYSLVKIAPSSD